MSPPCVEDGAGVPLRMTNYKLSSRQCPSIELVTELCSQQGRG